MPLIFDKNKTVFSVSLTLCILQVVLQFVSIKLALQMIVFRNFKLVPTLLHILRLFTFIVISLQIAFYRKITDSHVPLSWINRAYPAVWSVQVAY